MTRATPASPRVSLIRSPLLGQAREVYAPEGASLAQMADAATPDAFLRRFLIARIDGTDVPVEAWETTRPAAGQLVQFIVRAGDGDFFRTILQVAIVAAAVWVSGGGLAGVFGSAFASGTIGAALASAGVAIAGNLILNTLIPLEVPGQNSQKPSPFFTVTGARNSARLYQPAPLVLGKHRMFPPLWGQPIQETVGDDVYLRIPFCFGPAPMQISDIKIGETPLASYAGVELETRLAEDAPAHLLYAGDPDQDAVGAAITTTFQSRTSATDVDELEVIIGFAGGLGGIDSKGRKVSKTVTFEIQYRVAGSGGAWVTVRPDGVQASEAAAAAGEPNRAVFLGSFLFASWAAEAAALAGVASGPLAVTRADAGKGFQHRVRWAVPRAEDGYEVQLRRTTVESADSNTVDAATWAVLGSRKSFVDPFPNRKLASGVLRVKATDQLNGVIDTFNVIAEPLVPVFSSGALADPDSATAASLDAPAATRNPAHLILNVYRGSQNARPRPDSKINFPSFARFAKFCADNGLHFDEVVDGALTRAELARRIAQAGYGRLHKWGGKLAVVIDRLRTGEMPAQTFTPRNIANLKWRKSFPGEVHAVQIEFANAANGYQADEVTLYLDGYDASNATKFERLQVPGKTDADEVRIVGRQYINNSLRQLEQFSFDMDAEALTCAPGAYTLLQHDVLGTGLGAQRVKSLVMDGADVAGFVLDYPIATEAGPALACRWRQLEEDGGEAWFEAKDEVGVTRDADEPRLFTFAAPRAAAEAPSVGDMLLIGEVEQVALEVLVRDIAPDVGLRAGITVIPYAPERFTPDGDPLPAHDPKVTLPIGARPATPVLLSTRAGSREIAVSFIQPGSPRGVTVTGFDVAVREHGADSDAWTPVGQLAADERVAIAPAGDPEATYDIFVMAFGRDSGGITVYSDALIVEDIAAQSGPAAPAGCSAAFATRTSSGGASQLVLTANWTPVEDPDVLDTRVEMRVSTGPDVWAEIGQGRAIVGKTEIHGLQVGRAYTLGFVHLSRRGIASARTTIAEITAPDTLVATAAVSAVPGGPLDADFSAAIAAAAAAAASASAAATHATNAALAETNAETAETAAEAALTAATTQATNAATSASAAGASATSASGSAATASTQAANAATSASAAQVSSVAARATAIGIGIGASDFNADGLYWTGDFGGSPAVAADPIGATYANVTSIGRVLQWSVSAGPRYLTQKFAMQPVAGRKYKNTARVRATADATGGGVLEASLANVNGLDSSFVHGVPNDVRSNVTGISNIAAALTVASGWQTIATYYTLGTPGTYDAFWRPRLNLVRSGGAGGAFEVAYFRLEDVTESEAAAASATASASSASSAAASQSAAASSASAASTSATNAATQASNAATSASQASTSETNAAGSASTASTAASAAASSQSAAAGSASAAAGSASTASTQASNAASSASAANTSATSAATQAGNAAASATTATAQASAASASAAAASSSATLAARYTLSASAFGASDFTADGLYWYNGFGGSPTSVADPSGGIAYADVANRGRVMRVTGFPTYLSQKAVIVPTGGRRYRFTVELRAQADASGGSLIATLSYNGLDTAWAHGAPNVTTYAVAGYNGSEVLTVAGGWRTLVHEFSLPSRSTYDAAWRPRLDITRSAGSGGAVDVRKFLLEDISDITTTNANVTEIRTAVADSGGAYSYFGLKVGAGNRFASIEALASTKTNVSALRFTADKLQIYNNITDTAVFDVDGSQIKMLADLNVSAGITVGAARLKVALESIRKTGADGAAITWAGGTSIGNVPEYVLDISALAPLTTGEQYSVYLTGVTAIGATVYAKIITPGSTSTVTQNTDSAGGGGNPTRVMAKADSADAYDGTYNFRIVGTITILSTFDSGLGLWFHSGYMEISTWFNDGGGWDEGPTIILDPSAAGLGGYGASDLTGAQAFDVTVPVTWTNPIGAGSTNDFGITADIGGVVSDLHTVTYTKQASSGTRTASPAGETVKITAFPRNA